MKTVSVALLAALLAACATTRSGIAAPMPAREVSAAVSADSPPASPAEIIDPGDFINGDLEKGIGNNTFAFPSAFDLDNIVSDDNTPDGLQFAMAIRDDDTPQASTQRRLVIYTANLEIRVGNVQETHQAIEDLVKSGSGYISTSTLDVITFRVPPDGFDSVMRALEAMGEVVQRTVNSEDVTEQFFDLKLRLDVAEQSRQRLKDVLNKAGAVKDILEVERDIRRLTEEIEGMEGRVRMLADRVQMATITVKLTQKVFQPAAAPEPRRPKGRLFAWLNTLGVDALMGAVEPHAGLDGRLARALAGPRVRLACPDGHPAPDGFVCVADTRDQMLAVTPEDYRLRVRVVDLPEEGDLAFWTRALAEELREYRGYEVSEPEEVRMERSSLQGRLFRCHTNWGGRRWAYDVWLVQKPGSRDEITVIEYARVSGDAATHVQELARAVEGIKTGIL